MDLCSEFVKCLLAAATHACRFPEPPPNGNVHVGSGAEKDRKTLLVQLASMRQVLQLNRATGV